MLEFIGRALLGALEFILDLWLIRTVRRGRGRPSRHVAEDAANLALWEWLILPIYAAAAVLAGFLMRAAGIPLFFCVAIPGVAVLIGALRQFRKRMDL
ncbi:hypothetical protein DK842_21270 [Chromobacterium phragmitis]|uniref:Uncharacterized protein n=1 Tax=Chromobacterium phragmitis TaxID=2202141 RepID=A0A344UEA3_9NEIS|nr:hypothetical protein [Chromobacterium phragmitis]AXE32213.1 hypothetical protein DK842_21270 [Chromobacterium phragmitis]AXE33601.1 hypothetical protein DK843_04250 [Chromobacterium phragmitis]